MNKRKFILILMMAFTLTGVSIFVQGCEKNTTEEVSVNKTGSVAL